MADEPRWFRPGYQPTVTRRPSEALWPVQKDGRQVTCELRDDGGEAGVEVQLTRDGEFYSGRLLRTRWRSATLTTSARRSSATGGFSTALTPDDRLAADARHPCDYTLPVGADWSYEVKGDGCRVIAVKEGARVRLLSRNAKGPNARFRQLRSMACARSGSRRAPRTAATRVSLFVLVRCAAPCKTL